MAMVKPLPRPSSPPMRRSAGTRTPSNMTCAVGWLRQPIFFSFGPKDRPGVPLSTRNAEMPLAPSAPVRAMTR